jgi:thiamine biosynthesis protein ThiS
MLARLGVPARQVYCGDRFLVAGASITHNLAMPSSPTLTLNGESRSLDTPTTVAGLLASLGLDVRKVAVERNEEIVPRSAYGDTWLDAGDSLEIVHFIGGG